MEGEGLVFWLAVVGAVVLVVILGVIIVKHREETKERNRELERIRARLEEKEKNN